MVRWKILEKFGLIFELFFFFDVYKNLMFIIIDKNIRCKCNRFDSLRI